MLTPTSTRSPLLYLASTRGVRAGGVWGCCVGTRVVISFRRGWMEEDARGERGRVKRLSPRLGGQSDNGSDGIKSAFLICHVTSPTHGPCSSSRLVSRVHIHIHQRSSSHLFLTLFPCILLFLSHYPSPPVGQTVIPGPYHHRHSFIVDPLIHPPALPTSTPTLAPWTKRPPRRSIKPPRKSSAVSPPRDTSS
jgi:hypothetical protein